MNVQVVTLDSFFASESQFINVLKIDVEGADTWVLQGAESLLRSGRIGHIFFEENRGRMSELRVESGTAQRLLQDCGYRLETIAQGEWYARI